MPKTLGSQFLYYMNFVPVNWSTLLSKQPFVAALQKRCFGKSLVKFLRNILYRTILSNCFYMVCETLSQGGPNRNPFGIYLLKNSSGNT